MLNRIGQHVMYPIESCTSARSQAFRQVQLFQKFNDIYHAVKGVTMQGGADDGVVVSVGFRLVRRFGAVPLHGLSGSIFLVPLAISWIGVRTGLCSIINYIGLKLAK